MDSTTFISAVQFKYPRISDPYVEVVYTTEQYNFDSNSETPFQVKTSTKRKENYNQGDDISSLPDNIQTLINTFFSTL